ncbi:hypothetical protein QI155_05770 [Thermodesulfovibrio sp. 1176]|uniref:hypothetical protein n=1 Tax=Thermodesulfovibrio sp. 1176 TaxID=3043424 RepID=UPI0024825DBA|nr:hypothetical protein [Thermodesulfovibrio sp. 1176]MDI1472041.1 hypothetical protein [Thermodesulfovibrio sp. 1176]
MKRICKISTFVIILFIINVSFASETYTPLSGKNEKLHFSVKSDAPFDVVIKSETSSKGEINYIFENFDYSNYFQLEKGGTASYRINPTENVKEIIIKLSEGAILIDHGGKLVKATEKPQSSPSKPQPEPLPTGSFTADTVWDIKGDIVRGKLYLKDHIYRYDMIVNGKRDIKIESVGTHVTTQQTIEVKNLTIIVNKKTGKEIAIDHEEKAYYETEGLMFSPLYNPFEAFYIMSRMFSEHYKVEDRGSENIGQMPCDKKDLMFGKILIQTIWISKKYRFPVKTTNYIEGKEHMVFELKNIKETSVHPKIFDIPKGYKKMKL